MNGPNSTEGRGAPEPAPLRRSLDRSQLGDGCHCAVPPPGEKDADKARAETTEGASYKWRMVIAYDGTKFKGW
uniref:Uncharacterized protein n=1 Tax=Oryza sativa subsp. japonica TaxID=39947 RepID=Q75IH9_ORYSJ|nr:unknown protein [Oryza sativa Japonica Group]